MTEVPPLNRVEGAVAYLETNAHHNDFLTSVLNYFRKNGTLTLGQLEAVERDISRHKAQGKAELDPVTEAGMYRTLEGVFRVKFSKQGRLYAEKFLPNKPKKSERYEYAKGAIFRISASDRMSISEAQELGALMAVCCVCGLDLTDPKSVERGIGPVCAKRV